MADLPLAPLAVGGGMGLRLVASARFQRLAARVPGLRWLARAEGAALFDLIQGFVKSQVLMALVELRLLHRLAEGAQDAAALAPGAGLSVDRMQLLLQAGAGIGLIRRRRDGRYVLSRRGAAFLGVRGLEPMVRHHAVLYRDLADPVAFLRGETSPELARFWPYVFGAAAADADAAGRYSGLMEGSMDLVAADTLRLVSLNGIRHLMDVGGGTGAFLCAAGARYPALKMTLFDLPPVVAGAGARLARAGLADRVRILAGSFRDDPLPGGADAISLVRVLYDHADDTVAALLAAVHAALPPGGRVIVSEPMSGGARPDSATDVYFALYTAAMGTGRTRSGAAIMDALGRAGFAHCRFLRGDRSYVTSVVSARRVGMAG